MIFGIGLTAFLIGSFVRQAGLNVSGTPDYTDAANTWNLVGILLMVLAIISWVL